MNRSRFAVALLVLFVPIIGRALWFYRGVYQPPQTVTTPDYSSITLPMADISTPFPTITRAAKEISRAQVLIDINHDNLFTITELQPLFDEVALLGGEVQLVDYDKPLAGALKLADSYVVIAPTLSFLAEDLSAMQDFVQRGGKLLVIADPTRDMSSYGYLFGDTASYLQGVSIANTLVQPYGITFVENYLYNLQENEANFRNILLDDQDKNNAITQNVNKAVFYGTHSLETTEEKLIFAGKNTLSSLSDAEGEYPVAVIAAQGRVLALGDFTFMTNPFYKILDNQQLVQNIAHFLANERRPRTIKDFPYLFDRQAGLWMEKDSLLTQEKLERFSLLQASLGENKIPLSLVEKPIKEYDFLIAEKFSQYQALEDFLEPFDLKFENISTNEEEAGDESSPLPEPAPTLETPTPAGSEETGAETAPEPLDGGSEENFLPFSKENETEDQNSGRIIVPGLGTLSTNGIGLILFDQQENRNTLILLANNNEALSDLTGYFISGSLSNCAFYQDLAVCSVTKDPAGGNSGSTEEYGFADTIY